MGIEALSRGAAFATFVEKDRQALHCIRENCAQLGLEEKVQILGLDAATAVSRLLAPYDLIYLDPPYGQDAAFLLASIGEKQLLAPHGLLFLEERYQTQKPPPAPPQFERVESRKYGIVHLHQYRRQVAIDEIRHPGTPS
jgi:16S rRNA (guanine966-N2)-methyltransferase